MNDKNGLSVPNYDDFGDCSSNNGFVQRYISCQINISGCWFVVKADMGKQIYWCIFFWNHLFNMLRFSFIQSLWSRKSFNIYVKDLKKYQTKLDMM